MTYRHVQQDWNNDNSSCGYGGSDWDGLVKMKDLHLLNANTLQIGTRFFVPSASIKETLSAKSDISLSQLLSHKLSSRISIRGIPRNQTAV